MRRDVLATETPEFVSGTDEVWFNTMYRLARARRGQELLDRPGVPLFFGRIDYGPGIITDESTEDSETVYIGRRHVRDAAGNPLVVDWRAPGSMPFYPATPHDPPGVRRRRRDGVSQKREPAPPQG